MMAGVLEHNKNKFAARGLRGAHGWCEHKNVLDCTHLSEYK